MNSFIEFLDLWGGRWVDFALAILWQSSLLIGIVFGFDILLRRKIRPSVRYTLWFVVFVKLLLPPTLALPTGAAWWLRNRPVPPPRTHPTRMVISYSEPATSTAPVAPVVLPPPPAPEISRDAWMLLASVLVSGLLVGWAAIRWRHVARCVRRTCAPSEAVSELLREAQSKAGLRGKARLRITTEAMSPAVCGLFRPTILLPQSLIATLSAEQIRAVLLHELIHLRRRDVWANCGQALLQIFYWWHPLLWLANGRIRRLREDAVDDAVMFALKDEAEIYAPTLLEVAKLAFARPLASLGLVGILESRQALRQRIERLLNFTTPRRAGLSMASLIAIAAFTAVAVPMGEPPERSAPADPVTADSGALMTYRQKVNSEVFLRNLRARAAETMQSPDDSPHDILVRIAEGFGVDCTPPRDIAFDAATGEVTAHNSSEALGILDEVVKELNLPGGERILNPPHNLKQVLIEAHFYQLPAADFARLNLPSTNRHEARDASPWWDLSSVELADVRQQIQQLGLKPLSSPRIQTGHGIPADLFIGDKTNSVELECVPFVHDSTINVTTLARTSGTNAPDGKAWPDLAGQTNCAIFARVAIPDGNGVLLRAEHSGQSPKKNLIVLLNAKILEQTAENAPRRLGGQQADSKTLLADGKLLFQMGKLDEAEEKFQKLRLRERTNQAALYYLSLIKQSQARRLLDEQNLQTNARPIPNVPVPPPYAQTNIIYTSSERQKLYGKLDAIKFDAVSFSNISLREVVRNLCEQTKKRDPNGTGVNFIIAPNSPPAPSTSTAQPMFDPTTGRPIAPPPPPDLAMVNINLEELRDVRLVDVLDAIVKTADYPIKYSLLDYGIEFSFKGSEAPQLFTRTFKVDPNAFFRGLQDVGVLPATVQYASTGTNGGNRRYVRGQASTLDIQLAVVNFFDAVGVKLSAPKNVFFNDRQGTLTVHATAEDLDLIEQAIDVLNTQPPCVSVKARFVEADPEFLQSLLTNAVHGSSNAIAAMSGILTPPQLKSVLRILEKRDHADLLNEGQVTTLSGRQADFQVVEIHTIVNGLSATATNNIKYDLTNEPFGTILDVIPTVTADGYSIQMTVIPSVTEFLGYEDSKQITKSNPVFKGAQLPLPKARVRQMTASAILFDGQTLVLGNLSDDVVVSGPNGATARQPYTPKNKRRLFVFITANIVDSSGNRVHSRDYYDGPVL